MSQDEAKEAAGEAGAALVESGMRLGLGTGSTTAFAIRALGRRVQEEKLDICGVPTSYAAEQLARAAGIPLVTLDDCLPRSGGVKTLDLALDGADEFDAALNLIKGGGAAHTREKVVAAEAERFVVLADPSKEVKRLGEKAPVPVEVMPMAVAPVRRALSRLGAEPALRMAEKKDGPVVTDQGLFVVDARFPGGIEDAAALAEALQALPGVLGHGLFLGMATDVLIGQSDGSVERRRR